ncbi:ankyrin [Trypanosoma rangeli]|uniref:Ankyrin n=1 Tax=Trypanosoma rangeli TaxID=5698 RepID=A0A422NQB4_TRYRA|nr:ankyrin [Trypanosoma rangeli]RNF07700.1 ankyrin [Trypanosoma rangeli]|eukprot:RNF07700.1 ankyrin [Trypanosoma rangeli]
MRQGVAEADFFRAVATKDLTLLRRLIAAKRDVNTRGERNRTPLHLCVWDNYVDGARVLLEAGADINLLDDLHDTPFLLAGAEGRVEIMKYMLKYAKPDLTLRNRYGGSALIPACERGHVEMVNLLIKAGVNVDQVNDFGWTGLLEVLELGGDDMDHVDITKALIAAGADVNLTDKEGRTPLYVAKKHNLKRISKLLEEAGGRV